MHKIPTLLNCFALIIFQGTFLRAYSGAICERTDSLSSLNAPLTGITSSSILLTWEDSFQPDYLSDKEALKKKTYHVFKDGIPIGSTSRKTMIATDLAPFTQYRFTVKTEGIQSVPHEVSLMVTTKPAGTVINIRKYNAKGDGIHPDTESIQKSIHACPAGGTVLIPAGNYKVGHLDLKSDMTLHLEKNACLTFSGYGEGIDYPLMETVLKGPDGDITYKSRALVSGIGVHNVVITGEGTIDGNGENWWPHYADADRPYTIEFINSSNILVQGITIQDPPMWNNHLLYVDNAIYTGVKFLKVDLTPGHNGDGLNPDACVNVLIVGCFFGNQDDCIAIKSGKYLNEGNKRRRASEFITIRDCVFDGNLAPGSGPLGIALGSESSGGIKHILIRDCEFIDVASIANIKANRDRYFAGVEDVRVENCTYINKKHTDRWWNRAPVSVDLFYTDIPNYDPAKAEPFTIQTPVFRDIHFRNIYIENSIGRGIYICGLAESPIHDIDFDKVAVRSKDGVTIRNVDMLTIRGITVIPDIQGKN